MKIRTILAACFVMLMMWAAPLQAGDKVNINTASVESLQEVKGIGPKLAAKIVEYRTEHGKFKEVDDLAGVKGIGEKKLDKIKDQVTVGEDEEKHDD